MIRLDLSKCQGFVHHRSGWNFCISQLKKFHSRSGIFVDDFMERSFSWQLESYYGGKNIHNLPYQKEWVGFLHNPPNAPLWFDTYHSPQAILNRDVFQGSIAPSRIVLLGSGITRSGSTSIVVPRPLQSSHIPIGELKEKLWGVSSGNPESQR